MNRVKPRVLLVEDEPTILHFMAKIFESWGWQTLRAGTMAEGVGFLMMPLDLIVLDLMLPDGDGLQVLAEVKSRGITTPVVVSTARGGPLTEVEAAKPHMILRKPFTWEPFQALAEEIAAAFKDARATASADA